MNFLLLVINFLLIFTGVSLKKVSEINVTKVFIQGNFSIGRATSILIKNKLLDSIKLKTLELLHDNENYSIKTVLKNLQIKKIRKEELKRKYQRENKIKNEEFNIFLSTNDQTDIKLIATSDPSNKNYYKFIQVGMGRKEREQFILEISNKIVDILNNTNL